MLLSALFAAATFVQSPVAATPAPDFRMTVMRGRLVDQSAFISRLGLNAADYVFRLDYLSGRLNAAAGDPALLADLRTETGLELRLDSELLVNLCPTFAAVSGIEESFYNDDPHAAPDPVAFYVPRSPGPGGRYALVVMLHGRAQTESDLISRALFRTLADRSHAILVAPWGTGPPLWGDAAGREVFAIVDEMQRSFPIDRRRMFLAGFSHGGDGVFHVQLQHPGRFSAVLVVGGAIRSEDAFAASALRDRNVYFIEDDGHSPAQAETYDELARSCIAVSHYQTPATDDLYRSDRIIAQAWDDMFAGTVRNSSSHECSPSSP